MINTFVIYGENVIDSAVATWQSPSRKIHNPYPYQYSKSIHSAITDYHAPTASPLVVTEWKMSLRSRRSDVAIPIPKLSLRGAQRRGNPNPSLYCLYYQPIIHPQRVIGSARLEFPSGTIPPGERAIPQAVIAIPPQREKQSLSQSLLLANNASSIFH